MRTKKDNWVAFSSADYEFQTFQTFEEAEKWLLEFETQENLYSEEAVNGQSYIAKITHRTKYTITDEKSNYTDEEIEDGEWGHEGDTVGDLTLDLTGNVDK